MVALRHHFFFVAVQLQPVLQNGLPTVPVILVADSIVPLNATVKVVPLLPSISQPNTTLFSFTVPVAGASGTGPASEKVPLGFSSSCSSLSQSTCNHYRKTGCQPCRSSWSQT